MGPMYICSWIIDYYVLKKAIISIQLSEQSIFAQKDLVEAAVQSTERDLCSFWSYLLSSFNLDSRIHDKPWKDQRNTPDHNNNQILQPKAENKRQKADLSPVSRLNHNAGVRIRSHVELLCGTKQSRWRDGIKFLSEDFRLTKGQTTL